MRLYERIQLAMPTDIWIYRAEAGGRGLGHWVAVISIDSALRDRDHPAGRCRRPTAENYYWNLNIHIHKKVLKETESLDQRGQRRTWRDITQGAGLKRSPRRKRAGEAKNTWGKTHFPLINLAPWPASFIVLHHYPTLLNHKGRW